MPAHHVSALQGNGAFEDRPAPGADEIQFRIQIAQLDQERLILNRILNHCATSDPVLAELLSFLIVVFLLNLINHSVCWVIFCVWVIVGHQV